MLNIDLQRPSPSVEARPPLPNPDNTALFLDLDGTLAPIAATPDGVMADRRRTLLLRRVAERFRGRVAILSGRSIVEVDRILEGAVANVAGVHGLERRASSDDTTAVPPHPALDRVEETLACFAKGQRGLLVESKSRSVALHYRGHPPAEEACIDIGRRMAAMHGLQLQEGRMVVELRTPGPDKGDSLRLFMAEPPFAGATPVMVGDDLTDEHAFEAARDLGGWSVLVGEPRPTGALYRLSDPAAVLDWLEEAAS
jgi:trehalose 6-phosphate phosphatase